MLKSEMRSLIEGLSYALDAAEKNYFSHSKHVAYLSHEFADYFLFGTNEKKELYYIALLHDIGAGYVYNLKDHCVIGRDLILELFDSETMSEIILNHHEFYNGTGPFGIKGDEIPFASQIICFANTFDEKFGDEGTLNLHLKLKMQKWLDDVTILFNPVLVEAFRKLLSRESFLLDYYRDDFNKMLSERVQISDDLVGRMQLRKIAEVFSKIIDNKSPFTHRHSSELTRIAIEVTKNLGYDEATQDEIYISALLHDIGKLTIDVKIIDKPGKLNDDERFEINKHTYYTRWILEKIKGFERIVSYAANHHEKINGEGYPNQLQGDQLGELERMMSICDIYVALKEERPYRNSLEDEVVWSIIHEMAERGELDSELVQKIKSILYQ